MLVVSFNLAAVLSYLEPWIEGNVLAMPRRDSGYPYELNKTEAERLGWLLLKRFRFEPTAYFGVTKVCYRHSTAVIKIPIHEAYAEQTIAEIDHINETFSKADRKHFPYTIHVGSGIAIQERCRLMSNQDYMKRIIDIHILADRLKVFDTHVGNVGLALDEDLIKFIDVQTHAMLKAVQMAPSTLDILHKRESLP
jgi:hypothetical protein